MQRLIGASLAAFAMAGVFILPACAAVDQPTVKLTQESNRVHVEIGGKPFTDYYFGPDEGRPYVRPYMWPVRAADGTDVTSDQFRAHQTDPKADHPHHRSLWVAHGDVGGADHWSLGKTPLKPESWGDLPKQRHVRFEKVEGDTLVEDLVWEDKEHKPMLNERRTVRFIAYPDGSRGVDITSQFSADGKPVTFGDTKEAGLASVRVVKSISDNPVLTLSTGATSSRNPDKAKKDPGDEANVWGKEADWCDISGQINGKPYGVAILNSPTNPLSAKWHARRYGLVGANNIGTKDFDKSNPKIYTPFTIEPGKPATFRYRVIIHEDDVKAAGIAEKYKEFGAAAARS
jgi:Methane oxygenase PmoA